MALSTVRTSVLVLGVGGLGLAGFDRGLEAAEVRLDRRRVAAVLEALALGAEDALLLGVDVGHDVEAPRTRTDSRGGAYYSGPRARAGHPTRPADRVQHGHLLDRDGPLEDRRARARSGRVELLRDLRSLLRLHDRLPGPEPAAGAGRRLRAERRVRPRLHGAARAEEAQGRVPARRRAVRADPRRARARSRCCSSSSRRG